MLADFFEATALIKVLDFLLDEWETDFSQADIAREAGLNWKTVHLIMPRLEKRGLIVKTRSISRAKMYRVGSESDAFKALKRMDRCVSSAIIEKEMQRGVATVKARAH